MLRSVGLVTIVKRKSDIWATWKESDIQCKKYIWLCISMTENLNAWKKKVRKFWRIPQHLSLGHIAHIIFCITIDTQVLWWWRSCKYLDRELLKYLRICGQCDQVNHAARINFFKFMHLNTQPSCCVNRELLFLHWISLISNKIKNIKSKKMSHRPFLTEGPPLQHSKGCWEPGVSCTGLSNWSLFIICHIINWSVENINIWCRERKLALFFFCFNYRELVNVRSIAKWTLK